MSATPEFKYEGEQNVEDLLQHKEAPLPTTKKFSTRDKVFFSIAGTLLALLTVGTATSFLLKEEPKAETLPPVDLSNWLADGVALPTVEEEAFHPEPEDFDLDFYTLINQFEEESDIESQIIEEPPVLKESLLRKLNSHMGSAPVRKTTQQIDTSIKAEVAPTSPLERFKSEIKEVPSNEWKPKIQAKILANPELTVLAGSNIPCTLETKIVSDQPGDVSCTTSRAVYGATGRIVLIPAGSRVLGEYSAISLQNGQERLAVIWKDLQLPGYTRVALNATGSGPLGEVGLSGDLNKRFFERFGSALLISSLQLGVDYAIAREESRLQAEMDATGVKIVTPDFGSGINSMNSTVQSILQDSINIRPRMTIPQGTSILVRNREDIDFSKVKQIVRR